MSGPGTFTPRAEVIHGDCLVVMRGMEAGSVDAVVTDPPYGIGFMGREWDRDFIDRRVASKARKKTDAPAGHGRIESGGFVEYDRSLDGNRAFQAWCEEWAREALRVMKPGAHLVAFGGTRTFHRLTCALEDAGFEIRDCLVYMFGTGFPKSLDVGKAIDKASGVEREVVGRYVPPNGHVWNLHNDQSEPGYSGGYGRRSASLDVTSPATDSAKQWHGWGTALKPGWEPIILARKLLSEKTVAENVQRWGTGALNIAGCRLSASGLHEVKQGGNSSLSSWGRGENQHVYKVPAGRWPANVALDEEAAMDLDEQSGVTSSTDAGSFQREKTSRGLPGGGFGQERAETRERTDIKKPGHGDTGGASRFFYTAKADKADRGIGNNHPTVKPTTLMRWLCRLVTPPGGTILDPFCGSGSTIVAAATEGFHSIGIEQSAEYVAIAKRRAWVAAQPRMALEETT